MNKVLKKYLPKKILPRLLLIFLLPLIFTQCLLVFFFYDRHWEKIITRFSNIASNQINLVKNTYTLNGLNQAKEIAEKLNTELSIIEENKIIIEKNNFLKKKKLNLILEIELGKKLF